MNETIVADESGLRDAIGRDGFIFVHSEETQRVLARSGTLSDWDAFAKSWDDLRLDTYMADGGLYRRRRHAAYAVEESGTIRRKPHQPHYQSRDYNPLNGGIARWFEPIVPEIGEGPTMRTILRFCHHLFGALAPRTLAWHVEAHQFRIEARRGQEGRPTPEGMHRDGVDFVLVLLIARHNIASGTTRIHGLDHRALGSFTLRNPLDAALVDDARCFHGVTPVEAIDPAVPACRDVLVVTFRKE